MNNFKKLEELEVKETNFNDQFVKQGVNSSVGTFRFFGDILDHFIPRVMGIFVSMLGGETESDAPRRPNYPNRPN